MNRWNRSLPPNPTGATPHAAVAPHGDLYARWAEASRWRGFRRGRPSGHAGPPGGRVRIIVRAATAAALAQALGDAQTFSIPDLYRQPPPGASTPALHFTAELAVHDLPRLATDHPGLVWELAAPLRAAETLAQADMPGRFGPTRDENMLRAPALPRPLLAPTAPRAAPLAQAIAVIDFGCPFLNPRFAGAAAGSPTRVAALWDQDQRPADPGNLWWQTPTRTGYGRELDAAALAQLCAQAQNEHTLYRGIDYLRAYDDPQRRLWFATHGAHVLDMAGGLPDPLAALRRRVAPDAPLAADHAATAPLLFVQLPALTASDSSGGSLSAHLLDGLRYVLERCTPTAPLVVNISYGTFAGPHDGSSLIESAMDELLTLRPDNFAIVLGAGNGRQAGCHVRRTVKKDRSALLRFTLDAGDTTDTFVELWYPRPTAGQAPLRVRARTAGHDWSDWVGPGQASALADTATGELAALLQHEHQVSTGAKALALLALCPTAHAVDDEGPLADTGVWEIEVAFAEGLDGAPVGVDAWVERDDPGDAGQGAQPRFVGIDRDDENNTLSSIATGVHTMVVGGYRVSSQAVAPYSALPGAQTPARSLPLVCAACEEDEMQPGLAGSAVRTGETFRMNGTSVAAPVLARQLFNTLAASGPAGIGRSAWPGVLQALADNPATLVKLLAPP